MKIPMETVRNGVMGSGSKKEGSPGSGVDFKGKPIKDWEDINMEKYDSGVGRRKDSTPMD